MEFTKFKELLKIPAHLTQVEIAELMGVSKQTISYYATFGIGLDKAEEIATKFNRTLVVHAIRETDKIFVNDMNRFLYGAIAQELRKNDVDVKLCHETLMAINNFDFSIEEIEDVYNGKSRDLFTIYAVCKATNIAWRFTMESISQASKEMRDKIGFGFAHRCKILWDRESNKTSKPQDNLPEVDFENLPF